MSSCSPPIPTQRGHAARGSLRTYSTATVCTHTLCKPAFTPYDSLDTVQVCLLAPSLCAFKNRCLQRMCANNQLLRYTHSAKSNFYSLERKLFNSTFNPGTLNVCNKYSMYMHSAPSNRQVLPDHSGPINHVSHTDGPGVIPHLTQSETGLTTDLTSRGNWAYPTYHLQVELELMRHLSPG